MSRALFTTIIRIFKSEHWQYKIFLVFQFKLIAVFDDKAYNERPIISINASFVIIKTSIQKHLFCFLEEQFIGICPQLFETIFTILPFEIMIFSSPLRDSICVRLFNDFISEETKKSSCCKLLKYIIFDFRLNNS